MQNKTLATKSEIHLGLDTNEVLNAFLKLNYSDKKKTIITDNNVFNCWIEQLVTSIPELSEAEIIQLPSGEDSKCIEIAIQVWETLSENKISRGDLIINFGGGVITDLGGFIASLYKRGMSFVNIPTSLLAQVDASVGGKTGIDLGPHKNQIGVFNNAEITLINPQYLSTLPEAELNSGYAEMLKHGLIASRNHWDNLKSIDYKKIEDLMKLISESVQIKNEIVKSDPTENDLRKSLNFGHTIGHAIEGFYLLNKKPVKHGHAIAIGMLAEAYISFSAGLLNNKDWTEIHYIITDKFEKIRIDPIEFPQLIRLMENDKKNNSEQINFTLISEVGRNLINQEVAKSEIIKALEFTCV